MTDVWPVELPLSETGVAFVRTLDDINDMMRWLGEKRDVLAVDTESAGLDPWAPDARVRLFQIGDVNTAWSIDAVRWPGLIYDILENYQGTMTLHNMGFDAKYLAVMFPDLKFPWHLVVDTMILAKLEHNLRPAKLKWLAEKYFGHEATVGQRMLENGMSKNNWTWNTVPLDFEPYTTYAAIDCILGARVYRRLNHLITGESQYICELEHDVQRISTGMELHGFRVDREYCAEKSAQLGKYVEDLQAYCKDEFGVHIGSTLQLGKWFLDYEKEHGGKLITEYTATGRPQMSKDVLDSLAAQGFQLAEHAVKSRKAEKLVGTYFDNLLKFSGEDGIIHPQINAMQARTGRQSVTSPALQTIPADGGGLVRQAFIPHENHALFSADYSSVEMRLTAHFYDDTALASVFREADQSGEKFFNIMGRRIFGPEFSNHDPRYKLVKNTSYACVPLDTEIFTQRGWLKHDEVHVGDMTIGFNLENKSSEWTRIEAISTYDEAPLIEFGAEGHLYSATPDHRWLCATPESETVSWTSTEEFVSGKDAMALVLEAPAFFGESRLTEEDFLYLMFAQRVGVAKSPLHDLTQHPDFAADSFIPPEVLATTFEPNERKTLANSLTRSFHNLFGGRDDEWYDTFIQTLLFLNGIDAGVTGKRARSFRRLTGPSSVHNASPDFFHRDVATQPVWCVTTELGSWTACQNNRMFLTGNSAYGAGIDKMASMAGVPVEEMRSVAEAVFQQFPSIKGLQQMCMEEATRARWERGAMSVLTPFGRRLYMDEDKAYVASNLKTQGHAAELLKQATRTCDQRGLGPYLTLTIHDEIIFNVPTTYDSVEVINEIKECMEVTTEMGYKVPIPVAPQGPMDRWNTKD